jgi:hypothetical protein
VTATATARAASATAAATASLKLGLRGQSDIRIGRTLLARGSLKTALHLLEGTQHLAGLLAHAATATTQSLRGQQNSTSLEGEGTGDRSIGRDNSGHLFVLNAHTISHG